MSNGVTNTHTHTHTQAHTHTHTQLPLRPFQNGGKNLPGREGGERKSLLGGGVMMMTVCLLSESFSGDGRKK